MTLKSITVYRKYPLIKLHDLELFVECCKTRDEYDLHDATREQWMELAAQFQHAKGAGRISYMAAYCVRRAGGAI